MSDEGRQRDDRGKEHCTKCGRVHLYRTRTEPTQYVCSLGHKWLPLAAVSQARPDRTQG